MFKTQLDVIMEGPGPTDYVPKGLSTLNQFSSIASNFETIPDRDLGL